MFQILFYNNTAPLLGPTRWLLFQLWKTRNTEFKCNQHLDRTVLNVVGQQVWHPLHRPYGNGLRKHTKHSSQSSQPTTTRLNWKTTNNITTSSANQVKEPRVNNAYWRCTNHRWWPPLRFSKHQSKSPQTVLLRATLTRTIVLSYKIGSVYVNFIKRFSTLT